MTAQIFSTLKHLFKNFLMLFESRRKVVYYDVSLNPFRRLFVVPAFAWKKLQHTRIQNFSPFSMVGTKSCCLSVERTWSEIFCFSE